MISSLAVQAAEAVPGPEISVTEILTTAGMGMVIVFTVLVLITLFIANLPRVLKVLAADLPEVPDHPAPEDASKSLLPDEPILAAIGYVLHTELQREVKSGD